MQDPLDTLSDQEPSKKHWWILALLALLLVGGYFLVVWLRGAGGLRPAAPIEPSEIQPPVPLIAPVAEPEMKSFDEIEQYTGGKPLPDEPKQGIFLTDIDPDEHIRGNPATPLVMVEYAPVTSMYAQLIYPKLVEFQEKNKIRMHWVFRHYPGTDNENDYRAGQATECLAQQLGNDGFWRYLDLLMGVSLGNTLPLADLVAKGAQVGADAARLQSCIENEELYDLVLDDKKAAQFDSQIFVSPTFVFQNRDTGKLRIVEGLNTMDYMQGVLNEVAKED